MARLRVGGIDAGSPARLRIGGIGAAGAVPITSGRLRLGGIGATGTAAVLIKPFAPIDPVEPGSTVPLTAVLETGSVTPDSYSWTVDSGRPVAIVGTGASVVVKAPVCAAGSGLGPTAAFTVIAVRGVKSGVPSLPQYVRIDSPPQLDWLYTATGLVPVLPPVVYT